ncbi:MAG: hypothetical protein WD294_08055 [Phycisphaeraceae bacterium]
MSQITAEKKDEIFRHPKTGTIHFGRHMGVATHGDATWAAVQMGEGRDTRVLLVHERQGQPTQLIQGPNGLVHQPCLTVANDGTVAVVWNEATDDGWAIQWAQLDSKQGVLESPQVIQKATGLCLPPTAAFDGDALHVAWSQQVDGHMRIHCTTRRGGTWQTVSPISADDVDAFRPHLSAEAGRAVLAWDEYRDRRYQVVITQHQGEAWRVTATLGAAHERWLQPRTVVGPGGEAYAVWVVLKPVIDKLGIIDHWPVGMVAEIEADRVVPLHDAAHPSDPRIVADLRDGLLASKIYKGYVGLRRNPHLSIDDAGALWCVWECRGESEGSTVAGPLLTRRLQGDGKWASPSCLASAGYGYAVPRRFRAGQLPFACMRFDQRGTDVIHVNAADLARATPLSFDESSWSRWHVRPIRPEPKPTQMVDCDGQSYRLYWADTHVHSGFSPDAEGELDELAHFARDQAGLDILTIIDNDYYPHKAMTEPEWRIHQALAAHFSEEGRFLWLPGYEFTYHRGDLTPDFNHRCVVYPQGHGPLHRRIDPDTNSDHTMIPTLKAAGAMPYPHHCTYELIDNDAEWNVEVTSSWRVCIEETDFTIQQLKQGKRLGFIGSSDSHRSVPGLGGARTGVLATALTRDAVHDAYHQRRLLATQGHNIFIDFKVAGAVTGDVTDTYQTPTITANVGAPHELDYVELVRDGNVIHRELPDMRTCLTFKYEDTDAVPGVHFYFLRIKLVGDPSFNHAGYDPATNDPRPFSQDSRYPHNLARARGPFAWTSPVWVKYTVSK